VHRRKLHQSTATRLVKCTKNIPHISGLESQRRQYRTAGLPLVRFNMAFAHCSDRRTNYLNLFGLQLTPLSMSLLPGFTTEEDRRNLSSKRLRPIGMTFRRFETPETYTVASRLLNGFKAKFCPIRYNSFM